MSKTAGSALFFGTALWHIIQLAQETSLREVNLRYGIFAVFILHVVLTFVYQRGSSTLKVLHANDVAH